MFLKESKYMHNRLVWMDLEMTGLDPQKNTILEIATLVTDNNLNVLAQGPEIIIHHPEAILESMNNTVQAMHKKTALWQKVVSSEISLEQAEQETLDFLHKHCSTGTAPLCGNSVSMDRFFLFHHMPRLYSFLHYRTIDVSTLKEIVARWDVDKDGTFKKKKVHRALSDIEESIAELRYYKNKFFIN